MRHAKRIRVFFMVLLLALAGRLYYVQVLCADELSAAAQSQQLIPVLQENSKGIIYDRNMMPLTETKQVYYFLIHKDSLTASAEGLLERMEAEPAGKKGEAYLVYRTEHYMPRTNNALEIRHQVYGFCVDERDGDYQIAGPLLADLDTMYAGLLQKENPSLYFQGNSVGSLIQGTGVAKSTAQKEPTPTALVTSLDLEMQQTMEGIFEEACVSGCAVVTDTGNGQVIAMVSRSGDRFSEETMPNLAVEQAYPLGKLYELVKKTAGILDTNPTDAAALLGLGEPVFTGYPEEAVENLTGASKMTATAVQLSRLLTILANQGQIMPLTLVTSTAREESRPCVASMEERAARLTVLQENLAKEPLTGDGWAVGYSGDYAVILHLEEGIPKDLYERLAALL